MKVAILGYGKEGQAALDYWRDGNDVTVCDQNPVETNAEVISGPDYLAKLGQYDLIVRSPGIHPNSIAQANTDTADILSKVTTATNEFLKVCPSANIIGVTGTKGKGTTSSLIAKLLEAAGKTVHLGGNIGVAPLEMLKAGIEEDDWVVLEMSSFQLIDLKTSPLIATCLMIVPEHLNWHADMAEYVNAKQNIFAHQSASGRAVFNRANQLSSQIATASPASKVSYEVPLTGAEPNAKTGAYVLGDSIMMDDTVVCATSDVQLLGRHNLENVCAAIATVWEIINHNTKLVKQVVSDFKGLPHRLEFVREVAGVKYYNDSFAATPEAASAALQAISGPKVLILGGFDRGLDLASLSQALVANQQDVHQAVLIGASAERLAKSLNQAGFTNFVVCQAKTMAEILQQTAPQTGDSVVLSPGFASFDMFKNFEDRGLQFKEEVNAL